MRGIVEAADKELRDLRRRTMEQIGEDVNMVLSDLPDSGGMVAAGKERLEDFLAKLSELKDEAAAVGRMAAQ